MSASSSSWTNSGDNTTIEVDWPWVPNPVQPPRPWWGALLSWVDVHLSHPIVLHASFPWPQVVVDACYRFCCWSCQWDRPVYMRTGPVDNRNE